MNLKLGRVVSTEDLTQSGKIKVYLSEVDDQIDVQYTSPYLVEGHGGFVGIPYKGCIVLIARVDSNSLVKANTWFYLTTVSPIEQGGQVAENPATGSNGIPFENNYIPKGSEVYHANSVPEQTRLSSTRGNSLILSDSKNEEYQNIKAELVSATGKSLQLNDSINAVILRNEHGDKLTISTTTRGISLETKGNLSLVSREAEIDIVCVDGRNINIENKSTGSKRDPNFPNDVANINIKSKNGNVNITSQADGGQIKLETLKDNSNIEIKSAGSLNLSSKSNTSISSEGNVIVNGAEIHLN